MATKVELQQELNYIQQYDARNLSAASLLSLAADRLAEACMDKDDEIIEEARRLEEHSDELRELEELAGTIERVSQDVRQRGV